MLQLALQVSVVQVPPVPSKVPACLPVCYVLAAFPFYAVLALTSAVRRSCCWSPCTFVCAAAELLSLRIWRKTMHHNISSLATENPHLAVLLVAKLRTSSHTDGMHNPAHALLMT